MHVVEPLALVLTYSPKIRSASRLHSGRSRGPQISPKQPFGLIGLNVPVGVERPPNRFQADGGLSGHSVSQRSVP